MSVALLEGKNVKFVAWMQQCMICQGKRVWLKVSDEIVSPCPRWLFFVLHPSGLWKMFFSLCYFCLQKVRVLLFHCTSFSNEVFCIRSSAEIPSRQSSIPNNYGLHKRSQILQFVLLVPYRNDDTHLKHYPLVVRSLS